MFKFAVLFLFGVSLFAEPIDDFVNTLAQEAKKEDKNFQGFSIKRGEMIFTSKHIGKKGEAISCVSCHGSDFTKEGKHFFTGKMMDPLSRKTNPDSFTSVKKVTKWLKRNFNDVYKREGTPLEKGDVLVYMLSKSR